MAIFISGDPATQIPAAWSFVRHFSNPWKNNEKSYLNLSNS